MTNLQVVSIGFRVKHDDRVDYLKAEPCTFSSDRFDGEITNGVARFKFKQHLLCRTVTQARAIIDPYIEAWEIASAIKLMPGVFHLEYDDSLTETEELPPDNSNRVLIAEPGRYTLTAPDVRLVHSMVKYPSPPGNFSVSAYLRMVHEAWSANHSDLRFLLTFGYLLLTILEGPSAPRTSKTLIKKRVNASSEYKIDYDILNKLGELTSEKGGPHGRKVDALPNPLSSTEQAWLQDVIRVLLWRMGEHDHDKSSLTQITNDNLASFLY